MPKRKPKAKATTTMDSKQSKAGALKEPHEINAALSSPRMQALLADHRQMGARPQVEPEGDVHGSAYPLKEK